MRIQYLLTINVLLKTLSFVNEAAVGVIVLAGTFRNIAKGTTDPRVEVCLSKYLLTVISIFLRSGAQIISFCCSLLDLQTQLIEKCKVSILCFMTILKKSERRSEFQSSLCLPLLPTLCELLKTFRKTSPRLLLLDLIKLFKQTYQVS